MLDVMNWQSIEIELRRSPDNLQSVSQTSRLS